MTQCKLASFCVKLRRFRQVWTQTQIIHLIPSDVRSKTRVPLSLLQDLVDVLRQRMVLLAEESSRGVELLRQVGSELLCLQSSEVKLEGLVVELHAEAQHRAAVAESLNAELRAKAHRGASLTESLHAELHR